jgi:hypothetical protein
MRKPSGKIKINNAGEITNPKIAIVPIGVPRSEAPLTHAVERHGE